MSGEERALKSADLLVEELRGGSLAAVPSVAPTMGRLKRCSYTHEAMIELIIEHPEYNQNELAAAFGYTPSWISNILASDAFQVKMAQRREEVIDPVLKASIEERFKALAIQSLEVLQRKLAQPTVSDTVALRAAELGARALGIGAHAPPPAAPQTDRLEKLAERLLALQSNIRERTVNAEDVQIIEQKQLAAG